MNAENESRHQTVTAPKLLTPSVPLAYDEMGPWQRGWHLAGEPQSPAPVLDEVA